MPSFNDEAVSEAAPEEVWKLLYDPARFPDWWTGIATVDVAVDVAVSVDVSVVYVRLRLRYVVLR